MAGVEGPGQKPRSAGELVWGLANAGFAARCLHVVAELAVADRIDVTPVPVGELAAGCGADADALDRVLRLLTVHGVFARHVDGYAHTPASRLLRSDAVATMRPYARMAGMPLWWNRLAVLERSVRSYLLMDVLHDWPDEECVAILRAVRRVAPATARVLVVEAIVPDGQADARTATLDVIMLMLSGGRERTSNELRVLLAKAGFNLESVLETPGPVRIAEARPGMS